MVKTLLMDAGHGGHDGGAEGNGLKEKDLTLAIALETERILLRDYVGIRVIQTRRTDKFLTLKQRSDMSNAYNADLFVSVHINSAKDVTANGYESYISPYTSARSKLSHIHNALANYFKSNGIRDRGLKELAFYVLRWTNAPAILTENLFIVNRSEANFLKNNVKRIAEFHAIGIAKMLDLKGRVSQSTQTNDKAEEDKLVRKELELLKQEVERLTKLVGNGKSGKSLAPTVERGVALGITDGSRMGEPVKREEAVAMVVRAVDLLQ